MACATRIATAADLGPARAVWHTANVARGRRPDPARVARVAAKLAAPDALVLVAADGTAVVGMALAEPGRHDDGAGAPIAGLAHVSMVFVAPDRWGHGIGAALLDGLVAHAVHRGYARLQVWTGAGNDRALRLYRGHGFADTGRTARLAGGESIVHLVRA